MRSLLAALILPLLFSAGAAADESEWRQLFNGRDLDGWLVKIAGHELGDNYGDTFRVEDGMLSVRYDKYDEGFGSRFGHIFYDEEFSNYQLVVEYRFVGEDLPSGPGWARRNSGIMLHCLDPRTMTVRQDFPISVEFQFLAGLGDGRPRSTGNLCTPGTDVLIDGELRKQHVIASSGPTLPVGEWVRAEAIVRGDKITHVINGEEVHHYERPVLSASNVSNPDPAVMVEGRPIASGYISLQSESSPIDFRKVEIRVLEAE